MSGTLQASVVKDSASATNNLALDASGNVTVGNNLTVTGTSAHTGNATFAGTVSVTGTITGSSTIAAATGTLYPLVSGTAQASTSGTAITFTGIPSWVKRITVMFNGVSTNGTNLYLLQIGTGGVATTSGYTSQSTIIASASGTTTTSSAGFLIYSNVATYALSGSITITNVSGNIWVASGVVGNATTTAISIMTSGTVTLAGVLNILQLTTVNGTDTFDAGSINILYE